MLSEYNSSLAFRDTLNASSGFPILSRIRALRAWNEIIYGKASTVQCVDRQHKNNKEEFHYISLTDGFIKYVGKKQAEVQKQLTYSNTNLEFRSSQIQNMGRETYKRENKEFPHHPAQLSTLTTLLQVAHTCRSNHHCRFLIPRPPPPPHTHPFTVISSSRMQPPCCHRLLLPDTSLHL